MFYAQQKMGWFIDWQKIKKYLENLFEVVSIRYYVGIKSEDLKMRDFINKLKSYGYILVTKPLKKIFVDENVVVSKSQTRTFIYKANFDVEIACDMVLCDKKIESIVLFSGDSDFAYALKHLNNQNRKTYVYATKQTLSRELRVADYKYILLETVKKEVEYIKRRPDKSGRVL